MSESARTMERFVGVDVGAEIRQQPGTKRTGEHVGEIQNSDACERSGCSWVDGHRHEVILGEVPFVLAGANRGSPPGRAGSLS